MKRQDSFLLLAVVCIIATCGLIYELAAGTLASYLMGDSVRQFSFVIGIYLFSMGVGAYLSNFIKTNLFDRFVTIEYLVGFLGGISSLCLLSLFQLSYGFQWILYVFVFTTGTLVGIEIPILMRLLKDSLKFEQIVSRVLTFDYLGALLASLIFPLLFIPYLGLAKTSLFFGMLNILTGLFTTRLFKDKVRHYASLMGIGVFSFISLLALFIYAESINSILESQSFPGKIIHAQSTSYQRIILTRHDKDIRLFLNGNLQFSSDDEHRYHEALVHPAMQGSVNIKNILVLGGGDGIAVREILKYPELKQVTLVDLDPKMTELFTSHPLLTRINHHSLTHPKVKIINDDAFAWLRKTKMVFDCIIVDFPDPSTYAIAKLYTNTFYRELAQHLRDDGWCSVQCTSPYAARNSFWIIDTTIRSVGLNTIPYYNMVPSFGMWGYILCSKHSDYTIQRKIPSNLKYYSSDLFLTMRNFPKDMLPTKQLAVNKLNNQILVSVFEEEWNRYLN